MAEETPLARLYRHARREAAVVAVVWLLALTWTVGYCYLRGYQHPPDSWLVQSGLASADPGREFRQYAGLPEWVLFGILAPWLACTAFTVIFGLFIMKDDDLGTESEEADRGH
jgi:hypothetical protein